MKHKNLISEIATSSIASVASDALAAYPQLGPLVYSLQRTISGIVEVLITGEADVELSGSSPWAMQYKLNTGRDLCIPSRVEMLQSPSVLIPHGHVVEPYSLKHIVDYMVKHRGVTEFGFITLEHIPGTEIIVNVGDSSAVVRYNNNDMTVSIPSLQSMFAFVDCPLFDKPREVIIDRNWMLENITKPLYIALTGVEYGVSDPLIGNRLITDLYTIDKLEDNHSYNRVFTMMDTGQFKNTPSTADKACPNNGYTATLEFKDNLYVVLFIQRNAEHWSEEKVLTIGRVFTVIDGKETSLSKWHDNPPLVEDLKTEMGTILDRLVQSQA